jgi:anti-sigma B factor antagonist
VPYSLGVPGRLSLDVHARNGGATIVADGEIDLATSEEFAAAVRERLAAGPVLVDLRRVPFMDSSGVRVLNELLKESAQHGRELRLCSELQPGVVQILELTGMLAVLPLEECGAG